MLTSRLLPSLALALTAALVGCGAPPPAAAPGQPDAPPAAGPASTTPSAPDSGGSAAATPAPSGGDKAAPPAAAAAPSAAAQPAAARTDAPLATGITQQDVLDQVQKHADWFDKCVSIGQKGAKGFRAKITLKATIGPSGTVNAADVASSTSKNAAFDACVLDAFKKLTFPRPPGSGATMLSCPLNFDAAQVSQ